ncbi:hypothetical protein GIB67_026538 [Kingdonia uniflora]|uniref:Myb/SANT-like domain-containing protein n=1 Tax=Kingdonia uniflora TaxID=39325 RepID=A0A7J7PBM9_9MAGN|nr:hypothetical protein GIB67_026538 [Kingdonia uniflora]
MPPKNKKAQQEVTGDPSQDTPKQVKKLNSEMLHTFLALCKRELETTKDVGSGLSKDSWTKIREECNAKFHLTRRPKYFSNVWFYQIVKYNAWTWLLGRIENGFNAETRTFHLPPEEWDALIKFTPQLMTSVSQSESSRHSRKNKRKVKNTLDKLDELIEVIKIQGEEEELFTEHLEYAEFIGYVDVRLFAILDYVGLCYLKIRTSDYL